MSSIEKVYIFHNSFKSNVDGSEHNCKVYAKREDALNAMKEEIKNVENDCCDSYDTKEITEISASFYKEGYADDYDIELWIEECEVL